MFESLKVIDNIVRKPPNKQQIKKRNKIYPKWSNVWMSY